LILTLNKTAGLVYLLARAGWTLLVGLSLTACSLLPLTQETAPPPAAPQASWETRKALLETLQHWDVGARIAINNDGQGWQASIRWQQRGQDYHIELLGPFGQGRLIIKGNPHRVTLRDGNRLIDAADADTLLERTTGTRLPIGGLLYWIKGIPDPAQVSRLTFDPQSRVVRIDQNGWVIEFPNYIEVAYQTGTIDLPKRINAQQNSLKVKVVVQEWLLAR
jgi:outer membrane lipoprotein LolB